MFLALKSMLLPLAPIWRHFSFTYFEWEKVTNFTIPNNEILTTQFLNFGEWDSMTLFLKNHTSTFLCFMQDYQSIGWNLLEVWSFKSNSTRSKGKRKNRCNSEASCCQKKYETTDMFSLFLFFLCVLDCTRLSSFSNIFVTFMWKVCVPIKLSALFVPLLSHPVLSSPNSYYLF